MVAHAFGDLGRVVQNGTLLAPRTNCPSGR